MRPHLLQPIHPKKGGCNNVVTICNKFWAFIYRVFIHFVTGYRCYRGKTLSGQIKKSRWRRWRNLPATDATAFFTLWAHLKGKVVTCNKKKHLKKKLGFWAQIIVTTSGRLRCTHLAQSLPATNRHQKKGLRHQHSGGLDE